MAISSVRGAGPSPSYAQDSFQVRQRQTQQRSAAEGRLEITTADGDKVTLSFSNASERSQSGAAVARTGYGDAARARVNTQSGQAQVSVSVEGELSDEELADIRKLVQTLNRATRSLATGDTDRASKALQKANQLDTISQYSYQYQAAQETSFRTSSVSVLG